MATDGSNQGGQERHGRRALLGSAPRSRLSRRRFLAGAIGGAAGLAGVYELVDRLADSGGRIVVPAPAGRPAGPAPGLSEQHLMDVAVVQEVGVKLVIPPLHHAAATATVGTGDDRASLRAAQRELEQALRKLERRFRPTSAGLGVTVAWGLPYFRRYVPHLAERHLPVDHRASAGRARPVRALLDAIRFPSDPAATILEGNEAVVLLRSDSRAHIDLALRELFANLDVFELTSIRRGFVGGSSVGGTGSLPKRMAVAAGIPGSELMPDDAQLFLGFTSTLQPTLGAGRIANLETLGYSDGGPDGYFLHGTTMHLSHLLLDLATWYRSFSPQERALSMLRPPPARAGGPRVADDPLSADELVRDFRRTGHFGHSGSVQVASRLQAAHVAADGTRYAKGTAIPQRADFNTLDNPFFWTAHPDRDGFKDRPAAGLHFVAFHPTSDDFHRTRLAMDGVLPDGRRLPLRGGPSRHGLNRVLRTTHRQNFLVPPREHRSFPLVELI